MQAPTPVQAPAPPTTAAVGEAYFLFLQGRSLEGRGDVSGAVAAYRAAIALVPSAADVRAELAGLFAREGQVADAVTEGEAALRIDPNNHEAHRILGLLQSAMAEEDGGGGDQGPLALKAVDHLERALAGGRRDPGVEISLGRLYVRTGQPTKAIATLSDFLNEQPGYPEGVLLLVEALDATGEKTRAIAVLEPLVRDEPDLARARSWLAELYDGVGRSEDALTQWRELAQTNPRNVPIRTRFATSLINLGHLDEGRSTVLELAGEFPRDAGIWYLVSQVEIRLGNADGAERAARQIADIDSGDARGPLALAQARMARGDHRGAVALLEPLLAASASMPDPGIPARVALALSAALEANGDGDAAIRVLEDARLRAGRTPDVTAALAAAYQRDKRHDAAERLYKELLVADPDNPLYLAGLGWALVQQGQPGLGRAALEKAVLARPSDAALLDQLAQALFDLKQYRDAMACWDRALASNRVGIDAAAVTRKRDRARQLAGRQ